MAKKKTDTITAEIPVEGGDETRVQVTDSFVARVAEESVPETPLPKQKKAAKAKVVRRTDSDEGADADVTMISDEPRFIISSQEVKFSDLKKGAAPVDLEMIRSVVLGNSVDSSIMFRAGMKGVVWRELRMGSSFTEDFVQNRVNLVLDASRTVIEVTVG